jgi:hypothetical protein
MFVDNEHVFSDAQALTGTAVSTNTVDLLVDRNLGIGEPMAVVVTVDVALDGTTGDETYQVDVQTGSTTNPTTVIASRTLTRGDAAGTKYVIMLPADGSADRYLRLNYALGGTSPSGTLTAFLVPANMVQNDLTYPKNYNIQ